MGFAINDSVRYWTGNRIPYWINPTDFPVTNPPNSNRKAVEDAIAAWNSTQAVQLVPRNGEAEYVIFRQHPSSCQTTVGRVGGGQSQDILCAVGSGFNSGNVMHEIGHALGLYHEHQRPDRNQYVTVDPSVANDVNYQIPSNGLPLGAYDCGSIMHYPVIAGQITNATAACAGMGQRVKPSTGDIGAAKSIANTALQITSISLFVQTWGENKEGRPDNPRPFLVRLKSNTTVLFQEWMCGPLHFPNYDKRTLAIPTSPFPIGGQGELFVETCVHLDWEASFRVQFKDSTGRQYQSGSSQIKLFEWNKGPGPNNRLTFRFPWK